MNPILQRRALLWRCALTMLAVTMSFVALTSCNHDPNYVKQQYLKSGNKYYDRGKYKEARIMYLRALGKDARYGDAYYRMALTSVKMDQIANAVSYFRRAFELLPKGSADSNSAALTLSEIMLDAAQTSDQASRRQPVIDDVAEILKAVQKAAPASFEAHKIQGDLALANALEMARKHQREPFLSYAAEAAVQFREAMRLKPEDEGVNLALARTLAVSGSVPDAEVLYRKVIQRNKLSKAAHTELYRLLFAEQKPAEAEAALKVAIADNPKDFNYQTMLATHYYVLKDQTNLRLVLDKLKASYKEYPNAYMTAGDLFLRVGNGDEAIRQYEEGIKKDSSRKADYDKRIIEVLVREGKTGAAYDRNLDLLKNQPNDPEARGIKATFLLDKGDVSQAINDLQAVVLARPENFVARYNLGRAYFAKHEYDQATQQFQEALRLRPDYLRPRLALAQIGLSRREYESALQNANLALKAHPDSNNALLLKAAALRSMRQFDEANTILADVLKKFPKQADVLREMGILRAAEGKYAEAADFFRQSYDIEPSNVNSLKGEAEAYVRLGQQAKALQVVVDAMAKQPNRPELQLQKAEIYTELGRYDESLQNLKPLVEAFKGRTLQQADVYTAIGETYARMGDLPNSIAAMKQARDLVPDNIMLVNILASLQQRAGLFSDARVTYEDSLKKDPTNPEALNNLAFLMAETGGNLDEALTLANRAKQRLPGVPEVSDTIGWIYLKKNLSDSAVEIFKDLTTKAPRNPTYRYHYGMALVQKGDKAAAIKELKGALNNNPSGPEKKSIENLLAKLA